MDQRRIEHRAEWRAESLVSASLAEIYTPARPIIDPALFSGRQTQLTKCRRLLTQAGTTLIVYGDRGVGKTSFCNVFLDDSFVIRRNASPGMTAKALFTSMLAEVQADLTVSERTRTGRFGVSGPAQLGAEVSEKQVPLVPEVVDVNLLTARLRGTGGRRPDAFLIDEVQVIADPANQAWLAALSKTWADAGAEPLLILVGVGSAAQDLIGDEGIRYGGRHVRAEHVKPLFRDETRDIIDRRTSLGIGVKPNAANAAVKVAGGQPFKIHAIMLEAAYAWLDRHPADDKPTESPKFRVFGRRKRLEVDLAALGITVELEDLAAALSTLESSGNDWARYDRLPSDVQQILRETRGDDLSLQYDFARLLSWHTDQAGPAGDPSSAANLIPRFTEPSDRSRNDPAKQASSIGDDEAHREEERADEHGVQGTAPEDSV